MLCNQLEAWANMEHHLLPHSARGEKGLSRDQCGPDTGLPMEAACRVPQAEQGLASPLAGHSLEPRGGQYGVTPLVFPPVSPLPCWLPSCLLPFCS